MPNDSPEPMVGLKLSALNEEERERFNQLKQCFEDGNLALVRSCRRIDKSEVALVCAVYRDENEMIIVQPLARVLKPDELDDFIDPTSREE